MPFAAQANVDQRAAQIATDHPLLQSRQGGNDLDGTIGQLMQRKDIPADIRQLRDRTFEECQLLCSYGRALGAGLFEQIAAGLEVVDCAEPAIEEADLPALSGGLSSMAADAFRAAWVGIPNALVWQLARRG